MVLWHHALYIPVVLCTILPNRLHIVSACHLSSSDRKCKFGGSGRSGHVSNWNAYVIGHIGSLYVTSSSTPSRCVTIVCETWHLDLRPKKIRAWLAWIFTTWFYISLILIRSSLPHGYCVDFTLSTWQPTQNFQYVGMSSRKSLSSPGSASNVECMTRSLVHE